MPTAVLNGETHYWEEQGTGDALILFHGATASSLTLASLVAEFGKTHRAIAPDMRSMGRSAHVTQMPPSAWVDDAKALLDHLGIERAHVFGVSLGARVALQLVAEAPERVKSLMLEQPIIAMDGATNSALNTSIGGRTEASPAEQAMRERQHGPDWRQVVANYMAIRNQPELQAYYDARESAQAIKVPTLIFRGDQREPVHPIRHCLELYEKIPGSRLWIAPGVNGAPHAARPEEAYARMRETMAAAS